MVQTFSVWLEKRLKAARRPDHSIDSVIEDAERLKRDLEKMGDEDSESPGGIQPPDGSDEEEVPDSRGSESDDDEGTTDGEPEPDGGSDRAVASGDRSSWDEDRPKAPARRPEVDPAFR